MRKVRCILEAFSDRKIEVIMSELNQRQELFCLNLISGMTATGAAIKAGYSPGSAKVTASRMLTNANIKQRLQELNKPIIARVSASKEAKLEKLEEIYTHEPLPETISARDRIQAIAEHNKMEGDYAPEKHAVLGDIIIEIVHRDKGTFLGAGKAD